MKFNIIFYYRFCKTVGYIKDVPKCGSYPKKLCYSFGDKTTGWRLNSSSHGDNPNYHGNPMMLGGAQRDFPVQDRVHHHPGIYGNHIMQGGYPVTHLSPGSHGSQQGYHGNSVAAPAAACNLQLTQSTGPHLQTFNTPSDNKVPNSNVPKCDINNIKAENKEPVISDENKTVPTNNNLSSNANTVEDKNSAMEEKEAAAEDIKTEWTESKEEGESKVEELNRVVKKEVNCEQDVKPVVIGHIERVKTPDPDSEHELVIDIKKEPE